MTAGQDWFHASAPASLSNLGPGFDCIGCALDEPRDRAAVRATAAAGVTITAIHGAGHGVGHGVGLPRAADRNTAAVAAASVWRRLGAPGGLEMEITKGWPPGSGLGSSAASAVAGAVAANACAQAINGSGLDDMDILAAALDGEAAASGARHADNVAPALLGGAVIVRSVDPLRVHRVPMADPPAVAVVLPDHVVETSATRASLPVQVPLHGAVSNVAHAATLILGLTTGDAELVGTALVDGLVEPLRAVLVPGYTEVRHAAIAAGATGCCLSGSGPTMFAVAPTPAAAKDIAAAMVVAFGTAGLRAQAWVTRLGGAGARTEEG